MSERREKPQEKLTHLEDKEIQELLKSGTDLRQYSKQVEKNLKEVENKSIDDYIRESQNIASLHYQIEGCDAILERMESMLNNFQVRSRSLYSASHSCSYIHVEFFVTNFRIC